jgi:hypothetical protein
MAAVTKRVCCEYAFYVMMFRQIRQPFVFYL